MTNQKKFTFIELKVAKGPAQLANVGCIQRVEELPKGKGTKIIFNDSSTVEVTTKYINFINALLGDVSIIEDTSDRGNAGDD